MIHSKREIRELRARVHAAQAAYHRRTVHSIGLFLIILCLAALARVVLR